MDRNGTILHRAVSLGTEGSAELVEMILKLVETKALKLDVNAVDAYNNTALKKLAKRYIWGTRWGQQWTLETDASYQCMKVMLNYRERLGIDINKKCKFTE